MVDSMDRACKLRFSVLLVALGLCILMPGCGRSRVRQYMVPYEKLVQRRATEQEVIRAFGRPNIVVTTDRELRDTAKRFKPYDQMPSHVESRVIIYYADPWNDAEGHVVYMFMDRQGRASRAVFGGF